VLDLVATFVLMGLCVALAVGLVSERQRGLHQARQIWVLEEKVTGLYLAADWDVPAPFLPDTDAGASGIDAVPVIRPKVTKPADVGQGAL